MHRLGPALVAGALVLGLVGVRVIDADQAPAARQAPEPGRDVRAEPRSATPAPPTVVSLYGDSLAHQARPAFVSRMNERAPGNLVVSTRPGAALCDDRNAIIADLVLRRPEVLVLEYSGNSFTPCMQRPDGGLLEIGSPRWRARYVTDLRAVTAVAPITGTAVVWATAPPVRHPPDPADYPHRLASAVRALTSTHPELRVVDTGTDVAGDRDGFARSLPCRADEGWFCREGRVPVRAADGLHFDCHGTVDALGACAGYSAGGRRYGEALADAVLAPRRPERVSSSPASRP